MNITTSRKAAKKAVSAADANRRFSELLRAVKSGQSVVVTSHGKPVAEIVPVVAAQESSANRVPNNTGRLGTPPFDTLIWRMDARMSPV